jgi:hypothetical protein
VEALDEALGDILDVKACCQPWHANLIGEACAFRGIDQFMLDMYDRPEWAHQLMDTLAEGAWRQLKSVEEAGVLTLNNGHHYNDSGGIGYSDELPSLPPPPGEGRGEGAVASSPSSRAAVGEGEGGSGVRQPSPCAGGAASHVRLRDLWGFGVAQEAVGIGPAQHEEFLLNYQLRMLNHYGLNAYGCCEPYHTKYRMLEKVPRLRRVSVSPWSDLATSAEACRDRWIISWKPNPAMVVGRFDTDWIRQTIRGMLETTRGCVVEMVHKDTFTVNNDRSRLETWAKIAREEIARAG